MSDATPSADDLTDAWNREFPKAPGDPLGIWTLPSPRDAFDIGFLAGRASVTPSREAIAEAMFESDYESWNDGTAWAKLSERQKDEYRKLADAILALLAVPSTENEAK